MKRTSRPSTARAPRWIAGGLIATLVATGLLTGCADGHETDAHDDHVDEVESTQTGHVGHADEEDGEEDMVAIRPQNRAAIDLAVERAEVGSLDQRLELSGVVTLNMDRVAHVSAPVTSQVRSVMARLEQEVVSGEALAIMGSTDLGEARLEYYSALQAGWLAEIVRARAQRVHQGASRLLGLVDGERSASDVQEALGDDLAGSQQGELIQAYADWLSARVTLERAREAMERGVGSELEVIGAQRDLEGSQATFAAMADEFEFTVERDLVEAEASLREVETRLLIAERRLHMMGLSEEEIGSLRASIENIGNGGLPDESGISEYALRAPIEGRVIEKHLTQGEWVEPGEALFTIADLSEVWVVARLFERDLQAFRSSDPREARLTVDAYPGELLPASFVRLGSVLDPETRTAEIVYAVENPNLRLRPEMFAHVIIEMDTQSDSIVIPASAVERSNGETFVFVEEAENEFHRRDVQTGREADGRVEILGGLEPDEMVVVRGAFRLRSELERGAFGDGHAH